MLAVAGAGLISDDDVLVVGLGLPQVAALLAKRTHAPHAVVLLEIGVFEPFPREPAVGIADPRMWEEATAFGGMMDVLGRMLAGGRVSLGLLGALQVDPRGCVNTTLVRDGGTGRRFLGSGGANDIMSLARRTIILMRHEARRFRETVDFVTSPGRRVGGRSRLELGLVGEGPVAIVTDRALITLSDFGAVLASVHPGEDPEQVMAETPMMLRLPTGGPEITPAPSAEALRLLRTEIDAPGWYTR